MVGKALSSVQLTFGAYSHLSVDHAAILHLQAALKMEFTLIGASLVKYDIEKRERETKGENSTKKQVHVAVSTVLQTVPRLKQYIYATAFDNIFIRNL